MSKTVTISSITGVSDYDIWVSSGPESSASKIYIDTIGSLDLPYTFTLPPMYQSIPFTVKIYDDNGREIAESFGFPVTSPTPTPTVTPTPTITPTLTPTLTPTPTPTRYIPTTYYGTFKGNGTNTVSATYTLSVAEYLGKPQWSSSGYGTLRWDGSKWEVYGWSLWGTTYYNMNTSTYVPDTVNWVYANCAPLSLCSVSFTYS